MNRSSSSKRKPKVYATARGYKSVTPRRIAGISAPNEVWRFAARNDLLAHLETAVRLAKECFKNVEGFHFTYDIDPEIENESYITIRATVYVSSANTSCTNFSAMTS